MYSCRKTQKFVREKNTKFEETRLRKKSDYDEGEAERNQVAQEAKNKIEELKKTIAEEIETQLAKEKEEEKKNHKKARMGKCLVIVPLCFTGLPYGFFSEEFVKFIEAISSNAWITNYIGPGAKRSVVDLPEVDTSVILLSPRTGISVHVHEKRFFQATAAAFTARLAPIVLRISLASARLAKLVKSGGVRISKIGEKSKGTPQGIKGGAKSISKDKNWKQCLLGLDPTGM